MKIRIKIFVRSISASITNLGFLFRMSLLFVSLLFAFCVNYLNSIDFQPCLIKTSVNILWTICYFHVLLNGIALIEIFK